MPILSRFVARRRGSTFRRHAGTACICLCIGLTACAPGAKKPAEPGTGTAESTATTPKNWGTPSSGAAGAPRNDDGAKRPAANADAAAPVEPKKITPEDKAQAHKLVEKARDQLDGGQYAAGKETVYSALMLDPDNETARSFERQLSEDPLTLLNEATGRPAEARLCEFKIPAGDTLSKIAERAYTGELRATLFVSLSRLNELPAPKSIKPGQVVKVPALSCAKLNPRKNPPAPAAAPAPAPAPAPASVPKADKPAKAETGARAETNLAYQEGMKALQHGDKAKAYSRFRQAVEFDSGDARAQAQLRALQKDRDDAYRQCAAARTARDYAATVAQCDKVLAIDPSHEAAARNKREAQRLLQVN